MENLSIDTFDLYEKNARNLLHELKVYEIKGYKSLKSDGEGFILIIDKLKSFEQSCCELKDRFFIERANIKLYYSLVEQGNIEDVFQLMEGNLIALDFNDVGYDIYKDKTKVNLINFIDQYDYMLESNIDFIETRINVLTTLVKGLVKEVNLLANIYNSKSISNNSNGFMHFEDREGDVFRAFRKGNEDLLGF